MLNLADLLYRTKHELVHNLNAIIQPAGLAGVYHVSDAVNRVSNRCVSLAWRGALELALDTFFTEFAGDYSLECRLQWPICVDGMRRRVAVAHPISCSNSPTRTQQLRQIYLAIQYKEEYEVVRQAAMAMAACLGLPLCDRACV